MGRKQSNKCKTCQYRAAEAVEWECNYIDIVGHSRNCEPGNLCTKYKKGDRLTLPKLKINFESGSEITSIEKQLNKYLYNH